MAAAAEAWPGARGVNVSRVGGGVQGLGGGFGASHPALSQDGRYVAFEADFTNLVAGDTNNVTDVFVFDQFSKTTVRVSVPDGAAPGAQGNDDSTARHHPGRPVRGVQLQRDQPDRESRRHEPCVDVYVRDTNLLNPRTVRMSVGDGVPGTQGNNNSFIAGNAIAIDNTVNIGNVLVAFYSSATNLFPALDNNGSTHVYLRSCTPAFATSRPSRSTTPGRNRRTAAAWIPPSARTADSSCTRRTPRTWLRAIRTTCADIFVFDRVTRQNVRVSVDNNGVQGNGDSTLAAISATGRYVVFTSAATNLVVGLVDNNAATDVFLHDRDVNNSGVFDTPGNIRTTRASVGDGGTQGNGASNISIFPILSISDDGKFVVYETAATNFDSFGDTNGVTDVYLHNTVDNTTSRMSVSGSGAEANNFSVEVTISGDGKVVSYSSLASNLVAGDTNTLSDVFVVTLP